MRWAVGRALVAILIWEASKGVIVTWAVITVATGIILAPTTHSCRYSIRIHECLRWLI